MTYMPLVSVILPVRDEEKYITATLQTVANQNYPLEKTEVIIADGMSTDNTRQLVHQFIATTPHLKVSLVDNPGKTVPVGLNLAIKNARGEVIVRMDSHSVYPPNYISTLVEALYKYNAYNTGGMIKTVPANDSLKCTAIATALSHPFGVGNAYFRIGSSKAREVDTVPFGCFRREVFTTIGYFDEEMTRTQDSELNGRMKLAGLKIVLVPEVEATYFARDTYKKLFKMYYQYGLFKPLASFKLGRVPTIRQVVPLLFVLFLVGGLLLSSLHPILTTIYLTILIFYVSATGYLSFKESARQKRPLTPHLMLSFFILHFAYGIGYLRGMLALALGQRRVFTGSITISR